MSTLATRGGEWPTGSKNGTKPSLSQAGNPLSRRMSHDRYPFPSLTPPLPLLPLPSSSIRFVLKRSARRTSLCIGCSGPQWREFFVEHRYSLLFLSRISPIIYTFSPLNIDPISECEYETSLSRKHWNSHTHQGILGEKQRNPCHFNVRDNSKTNRTKII